MEKTADHLPQKEDRSSAGRHSADGRRAEAVFAATDSAPVIQRWAVPALEDGYAGQNTVRLGSLASLPASGFQNLGMGDSGIYSVPTANEAVLGTFLQGGEAVNTAFTIDTYKARGAFYNRGHVIARVFGGPGNFQNIVPIRKSLNDDMFTNIEEPILNARKGSPRRLFNLHVDVTYGGHGGNANLTEPERAMPATFTYNLTERLYSGAGNTRDPANWIDSGNGNMIPGGHQVKVNDLSGLGPAAGDQETQQGVISVAFAEMRLRLDTALGNAHVPDGERPAYSDAFLAGYNGVLNSEQFKTAWTTEAAGAFKFYFSESTNQVIEQMKQEQYQSRLDNLVGLVLEKYESLKLMAIELGNNEIFDPGKDRIIAAIRNTNMPSVLENFDAVRIRVLQDVTAWSEAAQQQYNEIMDSVDNLVVEDNPGGHTVIELSDDDFD